VESVVSTRNNGNNDNELAKKKKEGKQGLHNSPCASRLPHVPPQPTTSSQCLCKRAGGLRSFDFFFFELFLLCRTDLDYCCFFNLLASQSSIVVDSEDGATPPFSRFPNLPYPPLSFFLARNSILHLFSCPSRREIENCERVRESHVTAISIFLGDSFSFSHYPSLSLAFRVRWRVLPVDSRQYIPSFSLFISHRSLFFRTAVAA
jgi:hypothetical protein